MITLQIYRPHAVTIPENSTLRRRYPRYSDLSTEIKARIDFTTLFYDVFLDSATNSIVAIGPDLMNLKKSLFPMTITVNGRCLKYKLQQIKGITFVHSESLHADSTSSIEVVFHFKTFECRAQVNPKSRNQVIRHPENNHRLTLTTLQKNNPPIWISDWLTWHHRAYGVTRAIIYDNGSENLNSTLDHLKNLPLKMDIMFVMWPYPHGFYPYKYCQRGTLNHCRLRFAVAGGYCINLDIDEYLFTTLQLNPRNGLVQFLDKHLSSPTPGVLFLREETIPNIRHENNQNHVRSWRFNYRAFNSKEMRGEKKTRPYGRGKYIFSYDNVGYNAVHYTDSILNRWHRKKYSIRTKLIHYTKKVFWECTRTFHQYQIPKPRIDTVYPHFSEICFFHFRGLNTGWRTGGIIKSPIEYDATKHIHEHRIDQIREVINASGPSTQRV